ncbi:WD40 repeat-like protein [Apiospora arundinis]|uniref:GPI inositol-deacylase n=1 Tax=Apiospora arundinis TaxID=335852 RepID=A0ABR2IEQ6_9PEZI
MGSPQRPPYHTQSSSEDRVSYSSSEAGSLPRQSTLPSRSRFTRHFSLRQSSSQLSNSSEVNTKGPLGLTTVHRPSSGQSVIANIVFVHGLGGGSEHTWSKNGVLWPRDLLPEQPPFQETNVHMFGYDSNFKKSSTLNIHDFSKSLLNNMINNPVCPIILVGHSMGGLIMKQTYILAKQMSVYKDIAERITAIIFIATPHTGSELAPILDRIFRMTSGLKPYLEDLRRNSDTVQTINTLFPAHSTDLMLHSFYETQPLSVGGLRDVMIVPKVDAILNYAHEQSALLYGDHRSVCKFESADEHNFIAIWQAISSCLPSGAEHTDQSKTMASPDSSTYQSDVEISELFGVWEPPADELHRVRADRHPGTCEWLCIDEDYCKWLQNAAHYSIFWVRGPPGCGKSYLAGHVVEELELAKNRCCYYFFRHGDRVRSSMEDFLLSITWQMAKHPDVRRRVLEICRRDPAVASGDYRTLHRKLWDQGIFRASLGQQPTYWVVDAIDECRTGSELAKFLLRVMEKSKGLVRIIATSRHPHTHYSLSPTLITHRDIRIPDIQVDIARYLDATEHELQGATTRERRMLKELVLSKSNGCFLWVVLVLRRLRKIVGSQARLRALEEAPPGMDQLYARILQTMPEKDGLSRVILVWVTCSIRPLSTVELKFVLENQAMDEISDIETVLSEYCYDLVYIDDRSYVKMRHSSATRFLMRKDINSEYDALTIDEESANKTLAMTCLEYLNGPELKAKKRKMVATAHGQSAFASYACAAVHEHVNRCSASDPDILDALALFLKSNVLYWIEHLASVGQLDSVLQMAQVLKLFLRRKSRVNLLLGDEVIIIDAWATDLVRLVGKFSKQLLVHPESILHLIPPFCPTESAPYSQFAVSGASASIQVRGLSTKAWDDHLCAVIPSDPNADGSSGKTKRERLHSIGVCDNGFCIGTSLGRVCVFNDKTCLEEKTISHGGPVTHLQYATSRPLLASFGKRIVRIWNTETWEKQWEINARQNCLAMHFVDDDQLLLVALQNNTLLAMNLVTRTFEATSWTDNLDDPYRNWYSGIAPQCAAFNTDLGLLAVGYTCRSVLVYNYELESHQLFDDEKGLSDDVEQQKMIQLYCMAFSKLPDTSLLAVNYGTAELVLFDTDAGNVVARLSSVFFSTLVSSPDGRTLAAARNDGAIELYDFETLHKIYRIRPNDGAVASLAFAFDNTRFLVIRAGTRNCSVWSPVSLFRRDVGHESVRSPSLGSGSQDGAYDQSETEVSRISVLATDVDGDVFFVGKDDSSVTVHDTKSGTLLGILFSHISSIKALHCIKSKPRRVLVSVDTDGFMMAHEVARLGAQWTAKCLWKHQVSLRGIRQVLCHPESSAILISSDDQAFVCSTLDGKEVAQTRCEDPKGEPHTWAQNPNDASLLLYLTASKVQLHKWVDLEVVWTIPEGLCVPQRSSSSLKVHTASPIFANTNAMIITSFATQESHTQAYKVCFPASSFTTDATHVSTLPECQRHCEAIDMIIGMYRDRLVFLHKEGWVCSLKASGMLGRGNEKLMFHFAPPIDWLQTSHQPLIKVTKLGEILPVFAHAALKSRQPPGVITVTLINTPSKLIGWLVMQYAKRPNEPRIAFCVPEIVRKSKEYTIRMNFRLNPKLPNLLELSPHLPVVLITMTDSPNTPSTSEGEPYSIFTPRHRKILTVLLGLASLASPLTANIYLPLLPLLQDQYHASAQAINLTITLYVVVQAIMPIFFAPTADQYGRRLVSLASLLVYTVGSIGLAVNDVARRKYPALLLLRALQAFGSSACATTIWGVVSDVCIPAERGAMVGPVISISNVGTVLGPVVGGLVAWRTGNATWVFASMAIFSAVTLILVTVLLPETARSVVGSGGQGKRLTRKGVRGWLTLGPQWSTRHIKSEHGYSMGPEEANTNATTTCETNASATAPSEKTKPSRKFQFPNPLASLKIMLWKDTALILWLGSCSYAEWYTINAAWPQIFKHNYGWSELLIGLSYIPCAVTIIIAGFVAGPWMRARYRRTAREAGLPADGHRIDGFPVEKARIREMWVVYGLTHLSIVGLGWAVQYRAHPAMILVLQGVAGFVKSLLFSSFNTLLIDVHPDRPSTAAAAASLTRSGLSGIGLAILQPLADAMGWAWFFTLLALVVGVSQGAGMVVLLRWGQEWREARMSARG